MQQPSADVCRQPLESWKTQENRFSLRANIKESISDNSLILTQDPVWTSDLLNSKIYVCCFKPLSLDNLLQHQ